MLSRRSNYDALLDVLKMSYENYNINEEGTVFSKNGEIVNEERPVIRRRFCEVYARAYRFARGIDVIGSNGNGDIYSNLALSDYNTFNSFINNCVNEYRLYDQVGTGNLLYIPYQDLASYIFNHEGAKSILNDYLKCELENIINFKKSTNPYVKRV